MDHVGGDFGQGLKDEAAFVHQGMGDDQFLAGNDLIAVEQQVQIDGAGFPAGTADAADLVFDFKQAVQEGVGAEGGFDGGGGVEERGESAGPPTAGFSKREEIRNRRMPGVCSSWDSAAWMLAWRSPRLAPRAI